MKKFSTLNRRQDSIICGGVSPDVLQRAAIIKIEGRIMRIVYSVLIGILAMVLCYFFTMIGFSLWGDNPENVILFGIWFLSGLIGFCTCFILSKIEKK